MPNRTRQTKVHIHEREERRGSQGDGAFHVLLRVRSELGKTIGSHRDMVARKGAAMLGKMGSALGREFEVGLNEQIRQGTRTYLFLTTREGWNGPYVTDRCLLLGVHDTLDETRAALVPRYYAGDARHIKTWFEIGSLERLTRDEMNRIFVLSSGREIMSVIASSATVFRVGVNARTR